MTTIVYDRNAMSIYICGHAGFAEAGEDIVCAGVSALTEALLRRVRGRAALKAAVRIDKEKARVFVLLRPENTIAERVGMEALETVCGGYQAIAEEYPAHVRLEVK